MSLVEAAEAPAIQQICSKSTEVNDVEALLAAASSPDISGLVGLARSIGTRPGARVWTRRDHKPADMVLLTQRENVHRLCKFPMLRNIQSLAMGVQTNIASSLVSGLHCVFC